jgi:hypothetical protein
MNALLSEKESDQIRGHRFKISPVCDADLVDYEELYDELFSRMEQGIGAQLHPVGDGSGDGGDE